MSAERAGRLRLLLLARNLMILAAESSIAAIRVVVLLVFCANRGAFCLSPRRRLLHTLLLECERNVIIGAFAEFRAN